MIRTRGREQQQAPFVALRYRPKGHLLLSPIRPLFKTQCLLLLTSPYILITLHTIPKIIIRNNLSSDFFFNGILCFRQCRHGGHIGPTERFNYFFNDYSSKEFLNVCKKYIQNTVTDLKDKKNKLWHCLVNLTYQPLHHHLQETIQDMFIQNGFLRYGKILAKSVIHDLYFTFWRYWL